MAGTRSVGTDPSPAVGRTVRYYFVTRLVLPLGCLVLAWGGLAGAVLGGALHRWLGPHPHRAVIEAAVVAGAGLLVALVAVVAIGVVARRLSRQAAGLAAVARYLADEQVPQALAQLRQGAAAPASRTLPSPGLREFAAVSSALSRLQATAVAAATAEASLRGGFRQVLTSLGRRNQSLLHRQLRIIDTLEQQASSPAALADLFALDHLTTRMRRHAESLTVLAGAPAPRPRSGPVPVIDVIRAAVAETEDYQRVSVRTESEDVVTAPAVNDMIHLLAELIENAALFSPSTTRVEVRAERVANGFAIEVEDRGLGIAPGQLGELNGRLASPPDFDVVDADRLGLFVAGRLAARHAVEVSLTPSPYRGTKAIVLLPDTLVLARADAGLAPAGGALAAGRDQSPEPFTLVGAAMARPLSADREDEELGAVRNAAADGSATTRHGLPRRVRPEYDSPERPALAPGATEPDGRRRAAPPEAPAPDDARRLAASLQSGWQRREAEEAEENDAAAAGEPWDAVEQAWTVQHTEEEE
jgi:signal transduction histidine kinase